MADANNNDLWPSFDDVDMTRTPAAIMRELAATLAPKTNNLVEAIVQSFKSEDGNNFRFRLILSAPVLNYTYGLLIIEHGIELWPAKMKGPGNDRWLPIANEEELRTHLAEVFRHPTTARVIRSMIAQSRDVGTQEVSSIDKGGSAA